MGWAIPQKFNMVKVEYNGLSKIHDTSQISIRMCISVNMEILKNML